MHGIALQCDSRHLPEHAGHVDSLKSRHRHIVGARWDSAYGPNYRFRAMWINFVAVTEVTGTWVR
jgi:hypothetical protein